MSCNLALRHLNGRCTLYGRGCMQKVVSNSYCSDNDAPVPRHKRKRSFIDSLRIHVTAGNGGQGLPKYGGSGGRGGDIVAVAAKSQNYTLSDVRREHPSQRIRGNTGDDSKFFCLYGANAKPTTISVPLGVSFFGENGAPLGEVNKNNDKVLLAKGGQGGCAANSFAAQSGQRHTVTIDLKLIADIGFLGFPNAGKSTLLKALSNAKPKIASYPFTTVTPNIGILQFEDGRRISLADLPGLIEGAHANQGMGHKFLKHVERTKLLLFIVDVQGFQLRPDYPQRSALENIILLNKELELYQPELTEKPCILAVNKIDLPNTFNTIENIRNTFSNSYNYFKFLETVPPEFVPKCPVKFEKIVPISAAKDRISVKALKKIIRQQLDINADYEMMTSSVR